MSGPDRVRVVYTDLDGTMVGPHGCFFRAEDGSLTLEPARALLDLLAAQIPVVLVSGRTRSQLLEAARIFGAEGYIADMGSVIGWDFGREEEVLRGAMPEHYSGTLAEVVAALGVLPELFARYPRMIEYHAPWHVDHEADVMLRGLVDVAEADAWLGARGLGWLRLRDNGVLPVEQVPTLAPEASPVHVYHLMPDGLSKGLAVAWDLRRRGLRPDQALAIGDSLSDLDMAPHVRELWLTANGAVHDHMAARIRGMGNVRVAPSPVGLGWAQAVRGALG